MDLNRASVFVKVVQEGGVTAAARAIGLPKSSVSRAVALLEKELGVRLLRRSTRGVALTEAGAAFLAPVARGLAAIEEGRESAVSLDAEVRGTIRITAPSDLGRWLLPPLLSAFVERHPRVLVDVVLTSRVLDLVEEGVDLALRAGPLRDDTVVARRVPAIRLGLYAAPSYLERHGAPRRASELAKHRAVLFRAPRGEARWTLTGPRGDEAIDVRGALTTDDLSFAVESVKDGAGIGLLPALAAERSGGLTRVLPRYTAGGAPLHLVHIAGRYLPRRVAALRDFLLVELGAR